MSNTLGPLMEKNLLEVFGQRDSARREVAITGIYTADCTFFESEERIVGRDALNAKIEHILQDAPGFVFRAAGPAQVNHDLGRLQWSFGPIGAPPVVTGMDVAVFEHGRIRALYTFLDKPVTPRIEDNKALVRRFFTAVECGDLWLFDEIVAQDYDDHLAGQSPGRETLKRYFTGLRSAFADLKLPITAIVAEGDFVAVLNSVRGTHRGAFGTLEATGNKIDAQAFQLYRIAQGQLAEHWEVADFMTLMRQLQRHEERI